jgi:AraC-like DNA-binding protein
MTNERVFMENELTLSDVAKQLKTSTNNISWVLNTVYDTTFYDFINGYRVKEFIQKVENKEHLSRTILALSMESGFNSKSTFNKAFKILMKDTPSNFIKNHRAA